VKLANRSVKRAFLNEPPKRNVDGLAPGTRTGDLHGPPYEFVLDMDICSTHTPL
jgi:hypothetical protein